VDVCGEHVCHVHRGWCPVPNIVMSQLQNLYTKEIFQKVPEHLAGSRHRLDFPTCETIESCISLSYESVLLQLYDLSPAIRCYQTSDAWRVVFGESDM